MLEIHPEVIAALAHKQPVVALESTIITHGMPYPKNLQTALQVEADIRDQGALPATIAVMHGKLKVGLTETELRNLAQTGATAMKVSRSDLAVAVASGRNGATTVAATMIGAALAGIRFFATGGIGGVHRGGETSLDISADLSELGRTSVCVICAGAKAILDIPRTLEYLETAGVPVIAYQADTLPAFWSSSSAIPAPIRMDSAAEINRFMHARNELGISGGLLIANPIPVEAEIPATIIERYIEQALASATAEGISGKAVTPFLLQKINELSEGRSLVSNIALVRNNAKLAALLELDAANN